MSLVFNRLKQRTARAQVPPQIVLLVKQLSGSLILLGLDNANR